MALDVELVLLEPRDVELLASGAALELTRDVLFVVSNNPAHKSQSVQLCCSDIILSLLCNDSSGADTLSALSNQEHALFLDWLVDVVTLVGAVRNIVMGNVVNLVLLEELDIDNPGAVFYDFIHPFAVSYGLGAFLSAQHSETLAAMGLFVTSNADEKMDIGEGGLGLLELAHVSRTC